MTEARGRSVHFLESNEKNAETLDKMDENSIFRIIHRKGFLDDKWHLQIVFNEMSKFLWVDVDEEYVEHFKKKYKLKQI